MKINKNSNLVILLLVFLIAQGVSAQVTTPVSLESAIGIALKNNKRIQAARHNEQAKAWLRQSAYDIPKTTVDADYGQFNSRLNDTRFGVSQTFNFPTVYTRQKKALTEGYRVAQVQVQLTEQDLKSQVRQWFYEWNWLQHKKELLQYADSIYRQMEQKSELRFKTGETNILEKSASQSARQFYTNQLQMIQQDIAIALKSFNTVLQDSVRYAPQKTILKMDEKGLSEKRPVENLPAVTVWQHEAEGARWRWKTERARMLPDITLGYNNLSITGFQTNASGQEVFYDTGHRFSYINAGISLPLFFGSQSARSKAAKAEWKQYSAQAEAVKTELSAQMDNAISELEKYRESLNYFETQGLANAKTIIDAANSQLNNGDIDYLQWVLVVNQAITIKNEYLDTVNNYNKAVTWVQSLNNL